MRKMKRDMKMVMVMRMRMKMKMWKIEEFIMEIQGVTMQFM
jgi:hypothetical protein